MKTGMGLALAGALGALAGLGAGGAMAQDRGQFAYVGTSLFGEYETGHKGAGEDASADFSAEIDLKAGRMCYLLEADGLDEVIAAHIHEGGKDQNGPPVVTLEMVGPKGDDVCVAVEKELLDRIAKRPERYYINIHTKAFPEGAVRGQLGE